MIEIVIRCDVCDIAGDSSHGPKDNYAHLIRERLKAAGWLVSQRGGQDLCPGCRKEIRNEREEENHDG